MESFLHIKKFVARYHLPPSRLSQRAWLDRILDAVLDETLELALEHIGISPRDEICIRKLHMPVKLGVSGSDQTLAMNWSLAMAGYLQEVLSRNDPHNVIRYSSRLHGLIDFATGIATGDYQRAWAWHQLGFIDEAAIDSDKTAAIALITSLENEPVWILPVLKSLVQTNQFHRLVGRFQPDAWTDLALAALAAYGVDHPEPVLDRAPVADNPDLIAITASIVAHSAFTPILRYHPQVLGATGIEPWSLAVFTLLDAEPALLTRCASKAWRLIQLTAAAWQALGQGMEPGGSGGMIPTSEKDHRNRDRTAGSLPPAVLAASAVDGPETIPGPDAKGPLHAIHQPDAQRFKGRTPLPGAIAEESRQPLIRQLLNAPDQRASEQPGYPRSDRRNFTNRDHAVQRHRIRDIDSIPEQPPAILADIRRVGLTEFGGLIFLLPLIDQIGIVDEINTTFIFRRRPLRWVLHRLVLGLMPVDQRDPAALAFCGLRPGDELPGIDQPGPGHDEMKILAQWTARIIESLRVRLQWPDTAGDKILYTVCRRRARIVADPGWIEAVFAIKDVSTDIRRAALDLDPGFLPWLGVVIKFTYE
jgi:hypothetical protein